MGVGEKKNEGKSCLGLYAKDDGKLSQSSSFCIKRSNLVLRRCSGKGETEDRKDGEQDKVCHFEG